ncbi:MAG: pseudouridine synthase [Planctomycetota bacterium]
MSEPTPEETPTSAALQVRILQQGADFVAVSKPSGLLVHRDEHHPDEAAAVQLTRDAIGQYVYPFHRLDRATSGILLFGLSSRAAADLQKCLSAEDAHKDYLALMRYPGSNRELPATWSCQLPLSDDKDVARDARTDFEVLEEFDRVALVRVRIFTGRYHQIRRHANLCGRHVIGDTTHGKGRINQYYRDHYGLHRLFLHLERVDMRHPFPSNGGPADGGGERLVIEDPLAPELAEVLAKLRATEGS